MSEFNPREHFENQAGPEIRLLLATARKYEAFGTEIVNMLDEPDSDPSLGVPDVTSEEFRRQMARGGVQFATNFIEGEGYMPAQLAIEQLGTQYFFPHALVKMEQGAYMLWGGALQNQFDIENDEHAEGVMFVIGHEAQPTMIIEAELQQALSGVAQNDPNDPRLMKYYEGSGSTANLDFGLMQQLGVPQHILNQAEVAGLLDIMPRLEQEVPRSFDYWREYFGPEA